MSSSQEGNALASQNGCEMESIIRALYPQAQFEYAGLIDLTIDGKRAEIKSCQHWIKDSSKPSGRQGRFVFNEEQHKTLIEQDGDYIFIVHKDKTPIVYLRTPASKVLSKLFKGVKSVNWKSIIREVI